MFAERETGAFQQMITNTQHNTRKRVGKQRALLCGNIFSWGKIFSSNWTRNLLRQQQQTAARLIHLLMIMYGNINNVKWEKHECKRFSFVCWAARLLLLLSTKHNYWLKMPQFFFSVCKRSKTPNTNMILCSPHLINPQTT